MREKTVYFDNAATSFPKPPRVIKEVTRALNICGNPGRGSHRLSRAASEILYDCRERAAEMFGSEPERVVLTMNATHSLNIAIKGLTHRNEHVLISDIEHNSVLRPLCKMADRGVNFDVYNTFGGNEEKILDSISSKIRGNTRVIVANHASNICNIILPIGKIGKLCRDRGIIFIVDASQSAGRIPIDMRNMNIDALCMPGHKGLMGPQGSGLLIFGDNVDLTADTLIEGGSGSNSLDVRMPDELPDRFEAGTLMTPAVAGLSAGIEWIKKIYPEVNIIEANDGPDGRKFAYENGKEAEDIQNKYIVHKLNGIKVIHVYSGTFYGESVAKALEAENKYISIDLESLPVSGTKIRNSPYEYKDFMEEFVFDEYIKSRKGDNNE